MRILLSLLLVPVVATSLTVSIFIRTSPFEHQDAIRHLAALSGCEAAVKVGLARASIGEPGYHARNDADGDGIACNENDSVIGSLQASDLQEQTPAPAINTGGAKFVRP